MFIRLTSKTRALSVDVHVPLASVEFSGFGQLGLTWQLPLEQETTKALRAVLDDELIVASNINNYGIGAMVSLDKVTYEFIKQDEKEQSSHDVLSSWPETTHMNWSA